MSGLRIYTVIAGLILLCIKVSAQEKIDGLTFVAPPRAFEMNPMPAIQEVKAGWISLVPFGFTRKDGNTVIFNQDRQWWGERPEGIKESIRLARDAGLKIMLKPQIWMHGKWIGDLEFKSTTDWETWESSYADYILTMAQIAEENGVEIFCFGTELKIAIKKRTAYWRNLIQKIRTVYSGKLTYSSNWDSYEDVPFWDDLDYIGISAYFPLVDTKTPQHDELQRRWNPVRKKLSKFAKRNSKQILFTEFGYMSLDGCAYRAWELEKKVSKTAINEIAQANALDALFQTFFDESYWAGGFLWKWFPNGEGHEGYPAKDYTPQGKLAETILKKWYGKEE